MNIQKTPSFQIYNASAGSGKTFTLVKEYLKILLTSENRYKFQQILAITFTNKASAEMKERVLLNLQNISEGKETDMLTLIAKETNLDQKKLLQRAKTILFTILKNYSAFNITTIDSFTYSIVKTFAYDLKIPLNFEVEMDAQKLLFEAIDILISKIGTNQDLTKLLIDFSLQKSNEDKAWDITFELQNFAKILLQENDIQQIKKLSNKTIQDFVALKKKLQKIVNQLVRQLQMIGENALDLISSQELDVKDFYRTMLPNHFKNLKNDYKKAKFFDQSKLKERLEEGVFYGKTKPSHIKESIEAVLPELLDFYESSERIYQKLTLYKIALESIVPLAVLNSIQKELNTLKEENNIRLNAEFNSLIHNTIKNEPAPFIYERLGEKYRHYFIDEMQDTSVLQWKNLHKLIENALETEDLNQERGSLLLVGDAKQSIYRWRGSNPEQFIALANKTNPFNVPKGIESLKTNYRSCQEVITFNNNFFEHIGNLLSNPTYSNLYCKTAKQNQNTKTGGYVEISFLDKQQEEDKALLYPKKVFEIIQQLDPAFKKSNVCILVRKKSEGVAVANYLSEKGIAIISSETLLLENNAKIQFVIAVIKILKDKNDKQSRLEALFFLHEYLEIETEKHLFVSNLIHLKTNAFFKSLQSHQCFFSETTFFQLSFYEAIAYLIRSFHLAKKADAYIQYFLDFVLSFQEQKEQTITTFLEYWNVKKHKASIVVPETEHAVRIMTIHKSKGLEFPIVILPYNTDIYRQINPKVWYNTTTDPIFEGFEYLLLNFKVDLKYESDYGQQLYNERREKLELDNFNMLYVALTRAEEQLYIVTEKKKFDAEKINTFADLFVHYLQTSGEWNENQSIYTFGNPSRLQTGQKTPSSIKNIQQETFISSDWKNHQISVVTTASSLWDTTQGAAISFGNLVHTMLSEIKTENDVLKVLNTYYFKGAISKEEKTTINDLILRVLHHPKLQQYFKNDVVVWNERELLSAKQEILIPDRIVQMPDKSVVILDYKTGKAEKKHKNQLENYSEVLQQMQYKVRKKILVYLNKEAIIIDEF